jgi:hypothetical protein
MQWRSLVCTSGHGKRPTGRSFLSNCGVEALASPLVAAVRARLVELGFHKAFLWAVAGNVRADRFYQMDGWAPDGVSRTDSMWGVTVNEVRYQHGLEAPSFTGQRKDPPLFRPLP